MLIGYTSDERYVALPEVLLEFEREGQAIEVRSRATGAVHAELSPGRYTVTLSREGYGAKRIELDVPGDLPYQFRLLADGLLGYAWPKWVRAGERSEFRLHSAEAYKLELWRYGWRKEFIRNLGWYDEHGPRATVQITPDGDYTQTGVQWNKQGYTSPHHKQFVVAPARSGLYYFHAMTAARNGWGEGVGTGEDPLVSRPRSPARGQFFSFPWIVAPAEPSEPIAVLAANINWNAYNSFGGRSNYIHPDRFPPTPTVNARQELRRYTDPEHINYDRDDYDPLSFDRPEPINHVPYDVEVTDPIEGRAACHVAPAEWRFLGWMEREGLAYDLYAETQLHSGVLDLDRYKVLVITTHPEYWSSQMYYRVKQWVFERGGRLVYLGGNGLNCEVEFVDEQTMIVRNGDARRQRREKFESRFAMRQESEANLLGVVYDERGIMTAAPYRVVDASHWVYEGTGLKNGDLFGRESLHMRVPGGASGHETDKISPSSPKNVRLLAQGENPGDGGAHMVMHEPAGGGVVFSSGSICWVSSLLVDPHVSRITANVLRRFAGLG